MSDRIKKLKIKKQDGTFSDYIPIGADAQNIDTTDGESVETKLGKKPYYYNTVADMKADTKLKAGDMAMTLGYYEANDGGSAIYRIVDTSSDLTVALNNGLYAELNIDKEINVKQLGAYGDGQHDDTEVIQKAINKSRHVYLPSGTYLITNTINITPYSHIKGASMQNTKINTSITDFVFKYHSRINTAAWDISDAALEIEEFSCNCQNFLQLNQWDLQESQWKLQGTILPIHLYHLGLNGKYLSLNDPNIDTENISSIAELAPYGIGLCLSSVFDSVIQECRITGFGIGIFLDGCDINTIRDNRFVNNRSSCQNKKNINIWKSNFNFT